jgi:vancomycin resistance protein YoaR
MVSNCTKYFGIIFFCFYFGCGAMFAQALTLDTAQQSALSKIISSDLPLKVNGDEYKLSSLEISKWIREKTDLTVVPGYSSEIENVNYCKYKKSLICAISFSLKNEFQIKKSSQISLDEDLMKKYIADLARTANKDPEDAKFKIEDGKVSAFSLDTKGIRLDEEKSFEVLAKYFKDGVASETLALPFEEIKPQINIDSVDNMGITELIGEGRSNFRGSPKNRIFNIKVATSRYDGVLIKPNEEFSFVHVLGEVDGDHGYLPELVIKKDKTEPEFGGGICQVSTTAFRAAINSGLEITARRNHAYPVSYYNPQGMDATVYVPRPDLKFINNTPNYILIQTKIEGTELIFDFYGTADGRKVNIIGPKVVEKNPDGSMKTTFTQQVYDKDGNLEREDVFNSNYDSPSKYPHPGTTADVLTQKPNGWSDREWKDYKSAHGL